MRYTTKGRDSWSRTPERARHARWATEGGSSQEMPLRHVLALFLAALVIGAAIAIQL